MPFELGDTAKGETFFENPVETGHNDLFETISEAHYLPELAGPHDEALLESLVEKGCEDNQVLGQALDKLAHLVTEYEQLPEGELLRLEPARSMHAAQGLLHLAAPRLQSESYERPTTSPVDEPFKDDDVFEPPHEQYKEPDVRYKDPEEHYKDQDDQYQPTEETVLDPPDQVLQPDEILPPVHTEPPEEVEHHEEPETTATTDVEEQQQPLMIIPKDEVIENATNYTLEKVADEPLEDSEEQIANTSILERPVTPETTITTVSTAEVAEAATGVWVEPADLRVRRADSSEPRDLSVCRRSPHTSPRRAPSRESDAMQSPQPSGIPAVPSSPELFTLPASKSKQALFLETLLSSPSPKMYTSEVTITKHQCEPLNLGKHRKSASPTVSSCSDELKKLKEYGEPREKRTRRESGDDLAKISKVFGKPEDHNTDCKRKGERHLRPTDESGPLRQLQVLKTSPDFNIPDPLLVPKDKLNDILAAPGREIPALLIQRPELRLPEAFAYPAILQDPDILVISLSQLENIIENDSKVKNAEAKSSKPASNKTGEQTPTSKTEQNSQPKPIPSMDALAGDIDAATSAALNQMLWLPYLSQLEAAMACSQNVDFLKALNSSGYSGGNYPDLSQMMNPSSRFMGPTGFAMMPQMDYENRLQFAMWQEAMNQANASRSKQSAADIKELAKSSDVQNPYVHSTKNHQSKSHTSARTSPIAHNYNNACQRGSMPQNPFLQGMYPTMNPNVRPNMPLPGLQIPYFNPNMMGSQRSPRTSQQKSPTSSYFQNNNYIQSVKQQEISGQQRSSSTSSQESPRPRISVKSLQNLLNPAAAAASGVGSAPRRHSSSSAGSMSGMSRRRDEPEVGSTTPLGETPPQLPPHPHDPSIHHLWHPLFGNQKGYSSPWSWTTVTATGD